MKEPYNKIRLVAEDINVNALHWALMKTDAWNLHPERTQSKDSPHYGIHDIWARYSKEFTDQPHDSVWYPVADELPVKNICYGIMASVRGDRLGGVLITKIPAGKEVKPHVDTSWHAKYYEKFALQVASHPKQKFCFEDEELVTKPGDLFWFDNSYSHWVTNDTDHDRITMIICIRRST